MVGRAAQAFRVMEVAGDDRSPRTRNSRLEQASNAVDADADAVIDSMDDGTGMGAAYRTSVP